MGFYKEDLLPWHRGFDTFFGGLTSSGADYFTYSAYDENYGLDLRRNNEVSFHLLNDLKRLPSYSS